ncbi:MAG TPA: DNA-processing protein DprA [Dongiaceae bacterium]|nr:DNA-processing protein DprA [Dongiaceae bacterium]
MTDPVVHRVGLVLASAGRPGARRALREAGGAAGLPPGWEGSAQAELARAAAAGADVTVPGDGRFPPLLEETADPPPALFLRGTLRPDDRLAIAIMGARRATPWGVAFAGRLAFDLARAGFTVVSGLARGIDAAAHRGALEAGGRTLAFLGSGLDRIYPDEHRRLAERIAAHGAVLTELPFGTPPLARHFPERNRLIAGMSWATVVVEAARDSGSLITAGLALDSGRIVFSVPGPPGEPNAEGTNGLLRAGAHCCRGAGDVIEDLAPQLVGAAAAVAAARVAAMLGAPGSGAATPGPAPEDPEPLTSIERRIMEALSPARGADVDRIGQATGIAPGPLLSALLELELRGLVRQAPGARFLVAGRG